jgi:cytochrome c peroxidase
MGHAAHREVALIAALFVVALGTAQAQSPEGGLSRAEVFRQVRALAVVGRQMFSDPALSASGKQSCASCHSPAHAYGPPNALAVQTGGPGLSAPGARAVPSLTYIQITPQFTEHFHDSDQEGDESVDGGPTGGLTWDGRVDRGRDQALLPLLSPIEMANGDRAALAALIEKNYGAALREALGPSMPDGPDAALKAGLRAIETFEQDYAEFYPYNSKYDAYLAGKANLTEQEARGLKLFNDESKGNCAECHRSSVNGDGTPPQLTDYGMIAIGVPRNPVIPVNRDPNFYDLGLCGPERTDFKNREEYCGLFKTPSLRNVALRKSFFHNGVFHTLREAVAFYATRDTNPEQWYPRNPDGSVRKYDDLPAEFHENVNTDPPFDRRPGDPPALSDSEIDDIVVFLQTLTDGYRP